MLQLHCSVSASELGRKPLPLNTQGQERFDVLRQREKEFSNTQGQEHFDILRQASESHEHVLPQHGQRSMSRRFEVSLHDIPGGQNSHRDSGISVRDDSPSGRAVIETSHLDGVSDNSGQPHLEESREHVLPRQDPGGVPLEKVSSEILMRRIARSNERDHLDLRSLALTDDRLLDVLENGTLREVLQELNYMESSRQFNRRFNRRDNRERTWGDLFRDFNRWNNTNGNTIVSYLGAVTGVLSLYYTLHPKN